jgi:hypothetical protein
MQSSFVLMLLTLKVEFFRGLGSGSSMQLGGCLFLLVDRGVLVLHPFSSLANTRAGCLFLLLDRGVLMPSIAALDSFSSLSINWREGCLILLLDRGVLTTSGYALESLSEVLRDLETLAGVDGSLLLLFLIAEPEFTIVFAFRSANCFISDSLTEIKSRELLGPRANRQKNIQDFFCFPTTLGISSPSQIETVHLPKIVSMLKSPLYRCPSCTSSHALSSGGCT